MTVTDIMTTEVITIGLDDTLGEMQKIFEKKRFHHLLVLEEEELLGIISDRDVFREISPYINTLAENARALETLKKKAHQIMSRNPITVGIDVQIEDAVHILLENNISCLPVISTAKDIEGILTWKDILKHYVKRNNL
jgi:acetoin utilization protein AcuB